MQLKLSTRLAYFVGFLICTGLLAFALYLQYYEYQEPCPLCILQRVAFIAMGIIFLIGTLHGPRRAGAHVYGALLVLASVSGLTVAGRQVWLQHLPKDRIPECGPGLDYMLHRFPLSQALDKIFHGSGECAEVGWTFLSLSIAEWSLLCLLALGIWAVIIARTARR